MNVRAMKLPDEYRTKAAGADQKYKGVTDGEVG